MNTPVYSSLFACLYDEPGPVGHLGRGTHYSVFRSVEWLDVVRAPLDLSQIHDFAVIWDEDHDTRVIEVLEDIYMAGLHLQNVVAHGLLPAPQSSILTSLLSLQGLLMLSLVEVDVAEA